MPDFWSHHYAAFAAREKIEQREIKHLKWPVEMDPFYYFGAQGPDFFYYINKFNFLSKVRYSHIGNELHASIPANLFRTLFEHLLLNPTPMRLAYISGFVSHYIMDVHCHPIICELGPDSNSHKRIEMDLEALCLFHFWKLTRASLNIDAARCLNKDQMNELSALWCTSLSALNLECITTKALMNGHETMLKIQTLIMNDTISKLPFRERLGRLVNYDLSLLILPETNDETFMTKRRYDTFIEHYKTGINETAKAYLLIEEILSNEKPIDAFIEAYVIKDYLGEVT